MIVMLMKSPGRTPRPRSAKPERGNRGGLPRNGVSKADVK